MNLENFFCKRLQNKIEELETTNSNLHGIITAQKIDLKDEQKRTQQAILDLERQHVIYGEIIAKSIQIPDVSQVLRNAVDNGQQGQEDAKNVKNPDTDKFYAFEIEEFRSRDRDYYTYPLEVWKDLLDLIHPVVKKVIGYSKAEIADCENWSKTTNNFMAHAFHDARKSREGAIGVTSSYYDPEVKSTHSFNLLMDNELQLWVYEPQNNTIIGAHEDPNLPPKYQVRKVEF